jgi:putative oxidoreductase
MNENTKPKLAVALLLMRLGVGIVFLMWTIDKLMNPEHAARVFAAFYMIPSLSVAASYTLGTLQMILVLAFLTGTLKRYSYMAIFVMHLISTLSTYARYFDPWTAQNLLFFAAFPMLAACWALWSLRDQDTILSFDAWRKAEAN